MEQIPLPVILTRVVKPPDSWGSSLAPVVTTSSSIPGFPVLPSIRVVMSSSGRTVLAKKEKLESGRKGEIMWANPTGQLQSDYFLSHFFWGFSSEGGHLLSWSQTIRLLHLCHIQWPGCLYSKTKEDGNTKRWSGQPLPTEVGWTGGGHLAF